MQYQHYICRTTKKVKPLKSHYKYGDSIDFRVKESFIEKNWRRDRNGKVLRIGQDYEQLIVKCQNGSKFTGLGIYWFIKSHDGERMTETGSDGMIARDFDMNSSHPITFYLTVGPLGTEEIVIDSLVFYR